MALLDTANTTRYGKPEITKVNIGVRDNPAILVSGHDLTVLEQLLDHLGCTTGQLGDFGYYATGKKGEYHIYETESDLRDTENVPLKEDIYGYFVREVKPHVDEAWINLDATKIGYEISFNKYFYIH